MDSKYYNKYLSYKKKYIELKGGADVGLTTGEVVNKDIHYKETRKLIGKYTGMMQNGERDTYDHNEENFTGKGTMKYNNGNEYKGTWKNDMREGSGVYHDYSKAKLDYIYDGEWYKDNKNGKGTEFISYKGIDSDHSIYTGMWENNEKHGRGKLTIYNYSDSTMNTVVSETEIIGVWNNGIMREQQCKINELTPDNYRLSKYEGTCLLEEKQGNGTLITYDPVTDVQISVYNGTFNNNMMHGNGIFSTYDPETGIRNSIYEGTFKAGNKDGRGIMTTFYNGLISFIYGFDIYKFIIN
jgi:hypothetical protein